MVCYSELVSEPPYKILKQVQDDRKEILCSK